MKFIQLTDDGNEPVLFNLDHVSAIYSVHDHARVITTDCDGDEYYDVKESVSTIIARIQCVAESAIITKEVACTKEIKIETPSNDVTKGYFTF